MVRWKWKRELSRLEICRCCRASECGVVIEHFEDVLHGYGRGSWENYPDRKDNETWASGAARWTDNMFPYVRPQENGNKEDVRWLKLTDTNTASARARGGTGTGLRIETVENPFCFPHCISRRRI